MKLDDVILLIGGRGLLGSALISELHKAGYKKVLAPTHAEMDCLNSQQLHDYFNKHHPVYVFHLAALVYGIQGNMDNQLKSFNENTLISMNVLNACNQHGVKKIFYAGTVASFGYPYTSIPLKEEDFWIGMPHHGEFGYAFAKRHGLIHLQIMKDTGGPDYVYGLLTNLYGPHDRFDTEAGHVIPSLVSKAVHASETSGEFEVWGYPTVTRDFLYSLDAARALILTMTHPISGLINIASGVETTMEEVIESIIKIFDGHIAAKWMSEKPTGILKRYSDASLLQALGFTPTYNLQTGIDETIRWYKNNKKNCFNDSFNW